jgi:hypothetical protein
MKNYLNHIEKLKTDLNKYFELNQNIQKTLFLDGTGMLSSYQNTVLSILGTERLNSFDEIHLVSGSSYALFIYLAIQENEFLWNSKDVELWNKNVRKWHGVTPILSLIKFLTYNQTKISAGKFGGHSRACQQFFSERFLSRKLSSFSNKYYFWTYSLKNDKLVLINRDLGFGDLTVTDIISMASSVPSIFGVHPYNNDTYIDAMYAPHFSKFKYEVFAGRNVLHLNMFKDGSKNGIQSIKIHEHCNGNKLIRKDFYKFLLGLKNHEFELITKYALFGDLK